MFLILKVEGIRDGVGVMRKVTDLQPWESLMKQIVWKQLGDIKGKKILDFGSLQMKLLI